MAKYQMNVLEHSRYRSVIEYALTDKKYERLVVIMKMRHAMQWPWKIPQYLYKAVGDEHKFTEAAERWLSVNDCGSYICPFVKRFVYKLHGAHSLQCDTLWEEIPLEIQDWGGCMFLTPHTSEVYEWLNKHVSLGKGNLPKLVLEDAIHDK